MRLLTSTVLLLYYYWLEARLSMVEERTAYISEDFFLYHVQEKMV